MRDLAGAARRALAFALVACALACQSSFYDEYRASHPGPPPVLPRQDAPLLEVLAALHAPDAIETIRVEIARLAVFRLEAEAWTAIPFEAIRKGSASLPDDADYAVLATWSCGFDQGLESRTLQRAGYYLLPANRLEAWDHYAFRDHCRSVNEFRAARGELAAAEREAQERAAPGGARLSLTQAYRRGLAYVEAGRLVEARAMLVIGERSYRAASRQLRAAGREEALTDAERMRAALMRALGVVENATP